MKNLLKNLHLLDQFTTVINISQEDFVAQLKWQVDEQSTGIFSDIAQRLSFSHDKLKEEVRPDRFKIQRKGSLWSKDLKGVVAYGTLKQQGDQLVIDTEIDGSKTIIIPYYLFFTVMLVFLLKSWFLEGGIEMALPPLPIYGVALVLWCRIPFLMVTESMQRLKRDVNAVLWNITRA